MRSNRLMMMTCTAAALALLRGVGLGQSLNIDMNVSSGAGAGVPTNSFEAVAQQPGYWNNVNAIGIPFPLRNLAGQTTPISLTVSGEGNWAQQHQFGSSDFQRLMEDCMRVNPFNSNSTLTLRFTGLANGGYVVYTMAQAPDNASYDSRVTIANSVAPTSQLCGGTWYSDQWIEEVNYVEHRVIVTDGTLDIVVGHGNGPGSIQGVQLKKLPERYYVDINASGNNSGTSWADAFTDLKAAVQLAQEHNFWIEEVWVADGTYTPDPQDGLTAGLPLADGIRILGGFAGGETNAQQRDWNTNRAYLSGEVGQFGMDDNLRHVVRAELVDSSAVLDGFWITSGNADSSQFPDNAGGGIYLRWCSPVIRNCTIVGNRAAGQGAGVYINQAFPLFENCRFINNYATGDGGAVLVADSNASPYTRFVNCSFYNNRATNGNGGAVRVASGTARLSNCLFTGNSANFDGGGLHVRGAGNTPRVYVYNSTFAGNTAGGYGGGIAIQLSSEVYVYNSIAWYNTDNVYPTGDPREQISLGGNATVQYTCIQGWNATHFPGPGNLGADPQFVDADGPNNHFGGLDDNCRLLPTSPLIDRGNNALNAFDYADLDRDGVILEGVPYDLDYNGRRIDAPVADTGAGNAPVIDIGAYEWISTLRGDMNCDGFVNNFDIDPFVLALTGASAYEAAYPDCNIENGDINGDGLVNNFDIDAFVAMLSGG